MRILILNWRDIRSAKAGGAERITHEVARRLVERGHELTWLSSRAKGLPAEEVVDGVKIVRRGSELTTRLAAQRLAADVAPDVILEEINTLPYFAPAWSSAPVLLYMNQLAREVWWYETRWPVALVGWLSEPIYLQAYRRCDAITISASSRDDLRALGLRRAITIAPMAVDVKRVDAVKGRPRKGALIAIGRTTPSKRFDQAIDALSLLRESLPDATLTLIGTGRSLGDLESHARRRQVDHAVRFLGSVPEAQKIAELDAADVLVGTSAREGWGLTVTEAASRGIPAVLYDVPGFRDAVVHSRTGILVPPDPVCLADAIVELLRDPVRYDAMRLNAWRRTGRLSYEATADAFETALEETGRERSR